MSTNREQFSDNLKKVAEKCLNKDFSFEELEQETISILNFGRMLNRIETYLPGWHYASGYEGYDSYIQIQNENCQHLKGISLITLRHITKVRQLKCDVCVRIRLQKEKEERKARVERKKFEKEIKQFKQDQIAIKDCVFCGQPFYGGEKDIFCSKDCQIKSTKKTNNRRKEQKQKKARTEESKTINLERLFYRDKGVCWICGGKCDMSLDINDNYYPSIDHVFPISKGGKDTWDNIRLAHRICNIRKANKLIYKDVRFALT